MQKHPFTEWDLVHETQKHPFADLVHETQSANRLFPQDYNLKKWVISVLKSSLTIESTPTCY